MKWMPALSPLLSRTQPSAAAPPPQLEAEAEVATKNTSQSGGGSGVSHGSETDSYEGAEGSAAGPAVIPTPKPGDLVTPSPAAPSVVTPKIEQLTPALIGQTIAELLPLLHNVTGKGVQTEAFTVKVRETSAEVLQAILHAQLFESAPPDQHLKLRQSVQDLINELPHSKLRCIYEPYEKVLFIADGGLRGKSIDKLRCDLFSGLCVVLIDQVYPAHTAAVTEARVACLQTQILLGRSREMTGASRALYLQRAAFDLAVARAWCAQAVACLGDDPKWAGLRAELAAAEPKGLRAWRRASSYDKAWAKVLKEAFGQSAQFGQRCIEQWLREPELQVLALEGKLALAPDEADIV